MLVDYHSEMIESRGLTETEGNGVGSQNEGAPATTEEVADTTEHHKHPTAMLTIRLRPVSS